MLHFVSFSIESTNGRPAGSRTLPPMSKVRHAVFYGGGILPLRRRWAPPFCPPTSAARVLRLRISVHSEEKASAHAPPGPALFRRGSLAARSKNQTKKKETYRMPRVKPSFTFSYEDRLSQSNATAKQIHEKVNKYD